MSKRLAIAFAAIALVVAALLFASTYGDPPVTLVDVTNAADCPRLKPERCDKMDCNRRLMT